MDNLPGKCTKEIEQKNHDNRNGFIEGLLKLQSLKILRTYLMDDPFQKYISKS